MKLFDPTSKPVERAIKLAPRPASPRGLRLGLVENTKFNASAILEKLAERLARRGEFLHEMFDGKIGVGGRRCHPPIVGGNASGAKYPAIPNAARFVRAATCVFASAPRLKLPQVISALSPRPRESESKLAVCRARRGSRRWSSCHGQCRGLRPRSRSRK